jgi:hypothetical protein
MELCRFLLQSFDDPQLLSPILLILDTLYFPANTIMIGLQNNKPKTIEFKYYINNHKLDLRDCFMFTMDNAENKENVVRRYLKILKINEFDLIDSLDSKIYSEIIPFSKHVSRLSVTNKFNIFSEQLQEDYLASSIEYAKFVEHINSSNRRYVVELWQFILALDKDIFKQRKTILKKIDLDISIMFFEREINNISFREEHTGETNQIILSYRLCNHIRQIPININDTHSIMFGYNLCDLHLILLLIKIYDIDITNALLRRIPSTMFLQYLDLISQINIDIEKEVSKDKAGTYKKITKDIYVSAFVRKLPKGQKPSVQAIEFAKKYSIIG